MSSSCNVFEDCGLLRVTYNNNLFRRPRAEAEFPKSIFDSPDDVRVRMHGHPMVVKSFMSRQLFLRSYPFTREKDYEKKIKRMVKSCFGRFQENKEVDANSGDDGVKFARLRKVVKSTFRHVVKCLVPPRFM